MTGNIKMTFHHIGTSTKIQFGQNTISHCTLHSWVFWTFCTVPVIASHAYVSQGLPFGDGHSEPTWKW